jgi:putative oxidoreductase
MKIIALTGRILYSLIFITSGFNHFSSESAKYAEQHGIPLSSVAVPLSGILAIVGGISILIGFKARWGAWLIIVFLIPVTLMMHNFWTLGDPMMRQMQMAMFMKNISMLGGALLIVYHGAGPLSIDANKKQSLTK